MKSIIEKVFINSAVDINKNHNEAINVFYKYLQNHNDVKILVNFDSHSDLIVNTKIEAPDIANWVNYCLKEFDIEEYYWVLPDYIVNNDDNKRVIESVEQTIDKNNFFGFSGMDLNILKNNTNYIYYLYDTDEIISDANFKFIQEKCNKFGIENIFENINKYKKIKVTLLSLKHLNILKDKEILLSIDSDFFCNTGYDTIKKLNNFYITKEDLLKNFYNLINSLNYNEIKPVSTSLTYSPIYFPRKYHKEIEKFYSMIKN